MDRMFTGQTGCKIQITAAASGFDGWGKKDTSRRQAFSVCGKDFLDVSVRRGRKGEGESSRGLLH